MHQLFDPQIHRFLIDQVIQEFQSKQQSIKDSVSEIVNPELRLQIQTGLRSTLAYTPVNFYWIHLIENLLLISEITNDLAEDPDAEDELFEFWNSHEYSGQWINFISEKN